MTNIKSKVQPRTTNKIQRVVKSPPELTSATIKASNIQPITSFITPANKTTIPTGVSVNLYSTRIRQRTGNAVI